MSGYLDSYGVEDAKRGRAVRFIVFGFVGLVVLTAAYFYFSHDYSEKSVAKEFLAKVNAHDYQAAYKVWCPAGAESCKNYDFGRFSSDWGAGKKVSSSWKIDSMDSCKSFLTVNVTADGAELQSLSVQRDNKMLSFAPSPECQEYKWHWKTFFSRLLGRNPS